MEARKLPAPFHIAERAWDWRNDMLGPLGWRKHCLAILKDDLFAEAPLPQENLHACGAFGVMAARRRTQFIVWTNHPDRLRAWLEWAISESKTEGRFTAPAVSDHGGELFARRGDQATCDGLYRASSLAAGLQYPLVNVRLAAVVQTQEDVRSRLPELMLCKHENCVVIADPIIEHLDIRPWLHLPPCPQHPGEVAAGWGRLACDCRPYVEQHAKDQKMGAVGWIVAGGSYGPKAKRCLLEALEWLTIQGKDANVPVHISRIGTRPVLGDKMNWSPAKNPQLNMHHAHKDEWALHAPKGDDTDEWPGVLRVQQRPNWGRVRSVRAIP